MSKESAEQLAMNLQENIKPRQCSVNAKEIELKNAKGMNDQ